MKMWVRIKGMIKKYDAWCESLGLTPEQKRSCVPYKKDPVHNADVSSEVLHKKIK